MRTSFRTALVLTAAMAAGTVTLPASAATCSAQSGGGPSPATIFYELNPATDVECFSNDNDEGTSLTVFDMTYTLGDKVGDESGGDGTVVFTNFDNSTDPGTWAVALNLDPGEVLASLVIVLKQANSFAAFMIPDGTLGGTWRTEGPGGEVMDFSHASAWYKLGDGTNIIPLPASLPLFLAALAGLGLLTRRRREV